MDGRKDGRTVGRNAKICPSAFLRKVGGQKNWGGGGVEGGGVGWGGVRMDVNEELKFL